jgi:hypothetical protein
MLLARIRAVSTPDGISANFRNILLAERCE